MHEQQATGVSDCQLTNDTQSAQHELVKGPE